MTNEIAKEFKANAKMNEMHGEMILHKEIVRMNAEHGTTKMPEGMKPISHADYITGLFLAEDAEGKFSVMMIDKNTADVVKVRGSYEEADWAFDGKMLEMKRRMTKKQWDEYQERQVAWKA